MHSEFHARYRAVFIGLLLILMAVGGPARAERPQTIEEAQAHADVVRIKKSREKLADDPFRPLYHFSPGEGLLNDPNGVCQWRGQYHLFYQLRLNDKKGFRWGHAISDDMIQWKDLPTAIEPTIEKDSYSGQILIEDNRAIAMYHGKGVGNMIATSDDPLLVEWKKDPANPVIPIGKPDKNGYPYRVFDPCLWKENDGYYYCLSGSYKDGSRGFFGNARMVEHLFRSKNLTDWEYLGPMVEGGFWTEPGEDGAVPILLPISQHKHILFFFSHKRASQYFIGDYDQTTHHFTPTAHGRMNYGPWIYSSLHAPSAFIDEQGRVIAIFNVREGQATTDKATDEHPDWYGIMTLPRQYWLDEKDTLRMAPLPETESLRFDHRSAEAQPIPAGSQIVLDGIEGNAMEIDALIDPGSARYFGLNVLRSPGGEEHTRIMVYMNNYENGRRQIGIDVSKSTQRTDVFSRVPEIGPFMSEDGNPIRLRVFIDRSIIEVFVNDVQCVTLRVYPGREDSRGVSLFADGGDAGLLSLDAWQMHSIWPELEDKAGHSNSD